MKKLPVLFKGKISTRNKKMKGTIILFLLRGEFRKYFLKSEIYIVRIKILKQIKSQSKIFALVIEPGMKYMHSKITSPDFKNFLDKKKFSKKNNFVFEAHSTDYQPLRILKKLTKNNFKFLKVGPELTYNYSRSLFYKRLNCLFKRRV